jgi:argininosuccinate lyase
LDQASKYFTRIEEGVDSEYLNYYCIPHLKDEERFFSIQMQIQKAHVVMLEETGIISKSDASKILMCINEIDENGFDQFPLDPKLTDLYTNIEIYVIKKTGESVGGNIHTARSRNDLLLTVSRLYVREKILELSKYLLEFIKILLNLSKKHVDTVMPGFTHHSQHAQPITYGHFLMANVECFIRDFLRLLRCFETTNLSPMGAGAISTSGFPIDRKRVSDLLGFEDILDNSVDSISSRDYELQTGFAFNMFLSNISRLNETILLWNSREFGLVELADSFASTSTIMPQKKNPVALETIRADCTIASNYLCSMFAIINHITLGNGREPGYLDHCFHEISYRAIGISKIMPRLLMSLKVNKNRMKLSASQEFSTVTELADTIVREKELSFRTAHKIVGKVTAQAIKEGIKSDEISTELIDAVSREILGEALDLNEKKLKDALDPKENVAIRDRTGGPAQKVVMRAIQQKEKILKDMESELNKKNEAIFQASETLSQQVLRYIQ